MKIVDVCAFYSPRGGGVRTYIDRKLAEGPQAGHEIVVIAPGEATRVEERGAGARIIWLASPRFPLDGKYRYFADVDALHAQLDLERPDVVEVSSPWRSPSMVAAWPGRAVRSLVMHADPLSAYAYRWFGSIAERPTIDRGFDWFWRHLRTMDGQFDTVISASSSLTGRLLDGGMRHVHTIPMGVENGIFSPAHRDPQLRRHLLSMCEIGEEGTLLLGVGRLAPEKRWPMVVEAVTSAQFHDPIGLVLIGAGRERSRIVREIAANPHIRLFPPTGDRAQLARVMASADALIHGCEAETFCMVGAEAAASGLPIIAPDAGGAIDHVIGSNGISYSSGSARDAARAISEVAARPREQRAAATAQPRVIGDHFAELFGHYHDLVTLQRRNVA